MVCSQWRDPETINFPTATVHTLANQQLHTPLQTNVGLFEITETGSFLPFYLLKNKEDNSRNIFENVLIARRTFLGTISLLKWFILHWSENSKNISFFEIYIL